MRRARRRNANAPAARPCAPVTIAMICFTRMGSFLAENPGKANPAAAPHPIGQAGAGIVNQKVLPLPPGLGSTPMVPP